MFSLEGKVAVVTGGASGIGEAVVERFAAAGAKVVIADIQDASSIADRVGGDFIRADMSDESQVEALIQGTVDLHGHIDVCVQCAGIIDTGLLVDTTVAMMERAFRVNVVGIFLGMKHAVGHMPAGSAIINIGSKASVTAIPEIGAYAASKAAVLGLTRVAALEFGPLGIRVNCLCPFTVNTEMLAAQANRDEETALNSTMPPLGRILEPKEVAAACHFLAADDCPMISGQPIVVDGGTTAGTSIAVMDAVIAASRR